MEKSFNCNSSSAEFDSRSKLKDRSKPQHETVHDVKRKNFKCGTCGHAFSRGRYLINHIRTHTGERPFKCTVLDCGMEFKQEPHLRNHVKFKHRMERPFTCGFPDSLDKAKTSVAFDEHKKAHGDEWPFACPNDGCSFRAQTKSSVTCHVKNVHIKAETFACSECDYKTGRVRDLNRHMRRHSARRDFKYSHLQCSKTYKSPYDLKIHLNNQHGERTIHCDHSGCGQAYSSTKVLNEHKRSVHSTKSGVSPQHNYSSHTNTASILASQMNVHEGSNEKMLCSMGHVGLADSIGLACMLCDFVGYSGGTASDHAKCHRQAAYPIDKLNEVILLD